MKRWLSIGLMIFLLAGLVSTVYATAPSKGENEVTISIKEIRDLKDNACDLEKQL